MRSCHVWMARAACAIAAVLASPAWAVPLEMPYHGRVALSGSPYTGQLSTLVVRIYKHATSTNAADKLWERTYSNVPVNGGLMRLVLKGGAPALDTALLASDALWLDLQIGATALTPRQSVSSMPFAIQAAHTETLDSMLPEDFVTYGSDAAFNSMAATGVFESGTPIKIGTTGATCNLTWKGALRYDDTEGALEVCNGTAWTPLSEVADLGSVAWSQIVNKPSGFADDIDDAFATVFQAGIGLIKTGTTFSIDTTQFQRRMLQTCPAGHAISAVAADGTVTCVDTGKTYTAPAAGGLTIDALNRFKIKNCGAGQLLKWSAGAWQCASDAHATALSELSGEMSDAQVPDTITVNYAIDSDKVDGHHYSPVWDSTDAQTLNGMTAAQYASATQVQGVADAADAFGNNPVYNQPVTNTDMATICNNSMPTDICRRDVIWAGATPSQDPLSILRLSGGTWTWSAGQCQYVGGVAQPDPEICGQDIMPDWMDKTDQCAGFRQSTWDSRVWFAVAKQNFWDPTFEYDCPSGFRPMTTEEGIRIFKGPSAGALVYQHQCGWDSNVWNSKTRTYFRFGDSMLFQGSYKNTTDYDATGVSYSMTKTNFAGIICISETPPGPLDWMDTTDECGGFKQSDFAPQIRYAVSKKNIYDPETDYQCPAGYRWATTAEGFALFNSSLNQGYTYYNRCGWNGNQLHANGISRRYFRFSDSFKGATTLAAKDANDGEMYTVEWGISDDSGSNAFAGIVCIQEGYTPTPTAWMDTSDYCSGFRVSNWDPRFAFAVSRNTRWNPATEYACPAGWHWATATEVDAAFLSSSVGAPDQRVYEGQCGWDDSEQWNGVQRWYFRIKNDGSGTNRYMDARDPDSYRGTSSGTVTEFAGVVCRKDGNPTYPNASTLDWMDTSDDCKGFRESSWDPRVRFAVSRQNVFKQDFEYTCPVGYHWGTAAEYSSAALAHTGANTAYKKYYSQCGWNGYQWKLLARNYFFFRDTVPPAGSGLTQTKAYVDANHGDPFQSQTFGTVPTTTFAGIVCIRDSGNPLPSDWWMDKTDNCGGFRKSSFNPRVYYAIARKNNYKATPAPGEPWYTCPTGYTWADSPTLSTILRDGAEYNNAAAQSAGMVYHGQCGWTTQTDFVNAPDQWWHSLERRYFRMSDIASRYVLSYDADGYFNPTNLNGGTTAFAGIVCLKNGAPGPTEWMDMSDNCGGFRTSPRDSRVAYAVSGGSLWDRNGTYTCPAGYHWANSNEIPWSGNPGPNPVTRVYSGQCGWTSNTWNAGWNRGCDAYSNTGCGSTQQSPSPTHGELMTRPSDFARGCTECLPYFDGSTTCDATGITSGPDGKCGGIDEGFWKHNSQYGDCYFSANNFSGNPMTMPYGSSKSNHCLNGVCCSNGDIQLRQKARRYFRFADSSGNNTAMDANALDNSVPTSYSGVDQFAGIVCIQD